MNDSSFFRDIAALIEENMPFALAMIIRTSGSTPRKAGSKMIVFPDGRAQGTIGGGSLEKEIIERAVQSMTSESPELVRLELKTDVGMECGGNVEVYIEVFSMKPKLLIFGAGHIGQKLAPLGLKTGFQVNVIDERATFNSEQNFPPGVKRHIMLPGDFVAQHDFSPRDHLVIITHNHTHDQEILQSVVSRDVTYIGMIGSQKKIRQAFAHLQRQGIGAHYLERVHAPIGLKIKAETPDEIAVLIAAELLLVRYGKSSTDSTDVVD